VRVDQDVEELANGAGVPVWEWEVLLDVVAVPATIAFLDDVAGSRQVGHDRERGSVGDVEGASDVSEAGVGIVCDEQQHPSVVREEAPTRHRQMLTQK